MPIERHRRTLRLHGRSYSKPGVYWITVCTRERSCILGDVIARVFHQSALGSMVAREWRVTAEIRAGVELRPDEFVIMPDHLHGIVRFQSGRVQLGDVVRGFKMATTRRACRDLGWPEGVSLWQRGYFERVVREGGEVDRIRAYMRSNPARWGE